MTWTGSMSWDDEADRQRRRSTKPPNRATVEIVLCPTCKGRHIRCHKRTAAVSHWACLAEIGCPDWKEGPNVGDEGRAHIA